jgi:hypothetical protein
MNKLNVLSASARKRGVSLIEGVLYLVIALAVIVGGIVFFQQAQLSNNVTDTARAGVGISSQTRGLYQNQRDFGSGDITAALVSAGAVPSNFLDSAGTGIVHPFGGGAVTVNGNGATFAINFVDLSEAACVRLATAGNDGTGPLGTSITGMTIAADNSALAYDATTPIAPADLVPVTAADAATACADDIDVAVFYGR